MELLLACMLVTILLLLITAGFVARVLPRLAPAVTAVSTTGGLLLSVFLAAVVIFHAPVAVHVAPFGDEWLALTLELNTVSSVMLVLVSFLCRTVLQFSRSYLAVDAIEGRFYSWMNFTQAAVLTFILSGNLGLTFLAWVTISLTLHQLLLLYPERSGAIFSARKKFVISRMGDICLLSALFLIHSAYGTWDYQAIFAAISTGHIAALTPITLLIAACAAMKSAQFPFHSWLPDTMETPTPVSAFMHAGIINAGGYLVIRLSPLFVAAPLALWVLAVVGTVTAAFGAIVMLTQPTVKRALAYSTMAQMGFMMMQCGLGAFGLALLHIAAHSLYKAHSFLRAGSTIGACPRAAIRLKTAFIIAGLFVSVLLVGLVGSTAYVMGYTTYGMSSVFFTMVLTLALAYGIARFVSANPGIVPLWRGVQIATALIVTSLFLHTIATTGIGHFTQVEPPLPLVLFVATVFLGLFCFQCFLWRMGNHRIGRALYVHALNGFYLGTIANRQLKRLWPKTIAGPNS